MYLEEQKNPTFSTLSAYSTVQVQVWDWNSSNIVPFKGVFYLTLQWKFSQQMDFFYDIWP